MSDSSPNGKNGKNGKGKPGKKRIRKDRKKGVSLRRFDEKTFEVLLNAINSGLTIEKAAKATGFARQTVYSYLGRNPDKLDTIKSESKANWLSKLESLGAHDWRAFAWLLERNFPHQFALFTVQRHQISGSMKLEEKVQMVTEAELLEMHQAAAEIALQAPRFGNGQHGEN